jgi:hypothetical protein
MICWIFRVAWCWAIQTRRPARDRDGVYRRSLLRGLQRTVDPSAMTAMRDATSGPSWGRLLLRSTSGEGAALGDFAQCVRRLLGCFEFSECVIEGGE